VLLLIDRVIVTDAEVEIRYVLPTSPESEHVRFCHLRKDYFHHPTPRQQDKALGLRQLDDDQFDVVGCGRLSRIRAIVALIDEGDIDVVVGHRLHLSGQSADFRPLVDIRRGDAQGQ